WRRRGDVAGRALRNAQAQRPQALVFLTQTLQPLAALLLFLQLALTGLFGRLLGGRARLFLGAALFLFFLLALGLSLAARFRLAGAALLLAAAQLLFLALLLFRLFRLQLRAVLVDERH